MFADKFLKYFKEGNLFFFNRSFFLWICYLFINVPYGQICFSFWGSDTNKSIEKKAVMDDLSPFYENVTLIGIFSLAYVIWYYK